MLRRSYRPAYPHFFNGPGTAVEAFAALWVYFLAVGDRPPFGVLARSILIDFFERITHCGNFIIYLIIDLGFDRPFAGGDHTVVATHDGKALGNDAEDKRNDRKRGDNFPARTAEQRSEGRFHRLVSHVLTLGAPRPNS